MDAPATSPDLSPDLCRLLAAIEVLSPSSYRVDGRPRRIDTEEAGGGASPPPLAAALEQDFYDLCIRLRERSPRPGDSAAEHWHLARLSLAGRERRTWEPGWRIRRIEANGELAVERHGVIFRVAADGIRCAEGNATAGASCRVRVNAERRALLPGFVIFWGEADSAESEAVPWLVRLYWHLRPAAAAPWAGALTTDLDRLGIPFSLKALRDPRSYRRADAGVLFLEPEHFAAAGDAIRRCHQEVRSELNSEVPCLTFRLAAGLGVVEGPADGDSFVQHRCRLLAGAVARAFTAGDDSDAERFEAVAAAFRDAGLDPRRPHLAPGSTTEYRRLD